MTNEEAQIIIGNIPIKPEVLDNCYDITEYQEAKAMAIKGLEQIDILEKIRAEIEALKNAPPCFDDMFEYKYAVDDVLAIIDKYKGESEEME